MKMNEERQILTQMARRNNGVLKVDDVLQEAKDVNSILHRHFEWDDSEAAEQYRRQQARALIQKCRIQLVETEPVQIRAFVSLPTDREHGGGYRLTTEVMGDQYLKDEMLRDIQMTIQRWTKKLHLLDGDLADLLLQVEEKVGKKPAVENRSVAA